MAEVLSFGQNRRWRRFLVSRVPQAADPVLDVATGTAGVAVELTRRSAARVVGLDPSAEMLALGAENVRREGLQGRVTLVRGRAERLPFADGAFQAVTFTYLLRYVDDPAATLAELARVLKPGGTLASLEFHVPPKRLWRALWWPYTRIGLPTLGFLASREWYRTGRFLGPSISAYVRSYPLGEQGRLWRGAGLTEVRYRMMSLGGAVIIWGMKRG